VTTVSWRHDGDERTIEALSGHGAVPTRDRGRQRTESGAESPQQGSQREIALQSVLGCVAVPGERVVRGARPHRCATAPQFRGPCDRHFLHSGASVGRRVPRGGARVRTGTRWWSGMRRRDPSSMTCAVLATDAAYACPTNLLVAPVRPSVLRRLLRRRRSRGCGLGRCFSQGGGGGGGGGAGGSPCGRRSPGRAAVRG
jgi:hypothetical protein